MHFIRKRNERIFRAHDKSYVACTFQAQKFRNDGTITYEGPVFSNTILDVGLDLLASKNLGVGGESAWSPLCGEYINVGTDNTVPATGQSGLLGYVASTDNIYSSDGGYSLSAPAHKWDEAAFQFAVGSFSGENLTELALSGSANSDYFNRQLFRDGDGNATAITVLSDEGLRITARVYFYPDLQPGGTETGSFLLNGSTTKNYTREMTTNDGWATDWHESEPIVKFSNYAGQMFQLSTSAINFSGTGCDSVSFSAYTSGDYYKDYECVWNPGTFVGDFESIIFNILIRYNGSYSYEYFNDYEFTAFRLDSPITVTDTEEVKFTLRRSWGRYAA